MPILFDEFVASGFEFVEVTGESEFLSGNISTALGAFVLNEDAADFTWCDDLTVLVANSDLSDVLLQIGGYSDTGADFRFAWQAGSAGGAGTEGGGELAIGDLAVDGYKLFLGNGYATGGNGNWTGGVDLTGSVTIVPASGTLALLGLAGVSSRRRRR